MSRQVAGGQSMRLATGLVILALLSVGAPHAAERGMVIENVYGFHRAFVIDAEAPAIIGSVPLGDYGDGCVISPDGGLGIAGDAERRIWLIDLQATPPQLAPGPNPIATTAQGGFLAASKDGRYVVVGGGYPGHALSVVDLDVRAEVSTFDLGTECSGIDVCRDGSVLVSTYGSVRRLVIDAAGNLSDTGESFPGAATQQPVCAPDGRSGVVFDGWFSTLISFRTSGMIPVSERVLPGFGVAGAIAHDGSRFYARTYTGDLIAYDYAPATAQLAETPAYGIELYSGGGKDIALDHSGANLYIGNYFSLQIADPTSGAIEDYVQDVQMPYPSSICFRPGDDAACSAGDACDDGNPCTDDSCDLATGICAHAPDDSHPCSDGNACTLGDRCVAGSCVTTGAVDCRACPPGFITRDGTCERSYDLDANDLYQMEGSCDGTFESIYGCAPGYGFQWTDAGGDAVGPVISFDVQMNAGHNEQPGISEARLNGVPTLTFETPVDNRCSPAVTVVSRTGLSPASYIKNGLNLISILPGGGDCEGFVGSPPIDGTYVRVTVRYRLDEAPCTVGACDPATGACHDAPRACEDRNPCTNDSCDPAYGCLHDPSPEYSYCDDGDVCNGYEYCDGYGSCVSSYGPLCDDFIPCSIDGCDPVIGCTNFPIVGLSCDGNGDPCDGVATCDEYAQCNAGPPPDCDDGNPCTTDACAPGVGCVHTDEPEFTPCEDGLFCNGHEYCHVGGSCYADVPYVCFPSFNPCAFELCDEQIGCYTHFQPAGTPCSDGNLCNGDEVCDGAYACLPGAPVVCGALDQCHAAGACDPASGACSNPAKPDGTTCNDSDLCTTGESCVAGACTPASSGLNEPNPRTNGYYKRLCHGPHSGDELTDGDALCVATVAQTFVGISTVADLCAELDPSQPNNDACDRTDDDLMVLALNICRARVCTAQSIDSQCGDNANVGQSLTESDAILGNTSRDASGCAHAKCLDEEINTGRALELNTLVLRIEGIGVRLDWHPPYLDDGSAHPTAYHVWRRSQGSLSPFVKIGVVTEPTFLDAAAIGAYQYEVTAVMN